MARRNNRNTRFKRTIDSLNETLGHLKEELNELWSRYMHGKHEHNVTLMFVNDIGDDLPDGWSRQYDDNRKRYCYVNSSKNVHFWSANVSNVNNMSNSDSDSDLEDLHPNQYK